jgi:hypothetical protein
MLPSPDDPPPQLTLVEFALQSTEEMGASQIELRIQFAHQNVDCLSLQTFTVHPMLIDKITVRVCCFTVPVLSQPRA